MDKSKLAAKSKHFQSLTDISLPLDGYNILQLDGNAFHTFTKGFERPFDNRFIEAMNATALAIVENTPGARFAFVQSDEISVLLKTVKDEEPFFRNRLEKVVSLSAAKASVTMSRLYPEKDAALFDARFFPVPDKQTVAEHFIWRQRDCTKNSIMAVGQSVFSHKKLQNKNTLEIREMLKEHGTPWEEFPVDRKHGRIVHKVAHNREVTFVHKRTKETQTVWAEGTKWVALPAERFEESRLLDTLIP